MSAPGPEPPRPVDSAIAKPTELLVPGSATALARPGTDAVAPAGASGPPTVLREAMVEMLQASADAYGDVVHALTCDLGDVSVDMDGLEWLATTPSLLENEAAYRAAVERLQWWDQFLAELPCPRLLSEARQAEVQAHAAQRAQAVLYARDQALLEHQAHIAHALGNPDLTEDQRDELFRIHEDPEPGEWRVDPAPRVQAALAALPPAPVIVPITVEDLEPTRSFSGFNAVEAMRTHMALGPLAKQLDAGLEQVLRTRYRLPRKRARLHAEQLTGLFWLALRRALTLGNHRLATSVTLVLADRDAPVHEQFSRELLESWMHLLQTLPVPAPRLSLGQRLRGLLGGPVAEPAPAARPLLAGAHPGQGRLGVDDSDPKG